MTALFPPTVLYSQVMLANLTGTYRLSHQLLYLCGVLATTPQMNGNTAFYESMKISDKYLILPLNSNSGNLLILL